MDMEDLLGMGLGLIAIVGPLLVIGIMIWFRFKNRQSRLQKQGELYAQLLDKFGSGGEFSEFLKQEEGQALCEGSFAEPDSTPTLITWGIVLAFLGVGFLFLMLWDSEMVFPGVISLAIGLGCLAGALVSRKTGPKAT